MYRVIYMFRLTLKFGLRRVSRTDQRRKSRTPCIFFFNNKLQKLKKLSNLDATFKVIDVFLSKKH